MKKGAFFALAVLCAALPAMSTARAQTGGGVAVVVLDGRGWGHGVGLSQWGARYMAEAGQAYNQILDTFYPGTALGSTSASTVRVAVYNAADGRTTWHFPAGGEVRSSPDGDQAEGFPIAVDPGGAVAVTYDGTYHVTPLVTAQAAGEAVVISSNEAGCIPILGKCPPPGGGGNSCGGLGCVGGTTPAPTDPPPTDPPPSNDPGSESPPTEDTTPPAVDPTAISASGPVWAVPAGGGTVSVDERGRQYRGLLEATAGGGPLRVVNQVGIESYLKGMAEVPGSWPADAVRAQAVVARTYALRAMNASGELCDDDRCQVYAGAGNESPGQSAAVDATAGQILDYAGGLAATVYSADAGGISATAREGFGSNAASYPYLTTVRYDTPNPLPWHNEIALTDVASRLGYPGGITAVKIQDAGPSGRALTVEIDGTAGPASVDGRQFASRLGLRSTLFTTAIGSAASAPDAPSSEGALQVLPDDAAGLRAAAGASATAGVSARRAMSALSRELSEAAATSRTADLPSHRGALLSFDDNAAWWVAGALGVALAFGAVWRYRFVDEVAFDEGRTIRTRSRLRRRRRR